MHRIPLLFLAAIVAAPIARADDPKPARRLYVATPGIRNYLEYGGHGLLVYDIDDGHKLLRRIPTAGVDEKGVPRNVKGVAASAATGRIYVSTTHTLQCLDLTTDKPLWEVSPAGGCDRMGIAPDGSFLYVPSFEGDNWNVIDGATGRTIAVLRPKSGAHNTIVGPNGREAYLAGLHSPLLTIADTSSHKAVRAVGPFSASVRPFTVDGAQRRAFVNVDELLGFEIGDIATGRVLGRVEVEGYSRGPIKRHGCPSHGIALSTDEKELWLCDAANRRLHVFDLTTTPPKQVASVELKDEPGWITMSLDGQLVYPSTGDVIDRASRKIVDELVDESGQPVQSEKMVEILFEGDRPVRNGDQFGIGQVRSE